MWPATIGTGSSDAGEGRVVQAGVAYFGRYEVDLTRKVVTHPPRSGPLAPVHRAA